MINWLRHNFAATLLLTLVRIYLGFCWLLDGLSKLTANPEYSAKAFIKNTIEFGVQNSDSKYQQVYPLWTEFLKFLTNDGNNTGIVSAVIIYGSITIGVFLILGLLTIPTSFVSLLFGLAFMFSGVIGYYPIIILLSSLVLMAGFNAAKLGIDRWLTPWFRLNLPFLRNNAVHEAQIEKITGF